MKTKLTIALSLAFLSITGMAQNNLKKEKEVIISIGIATTSIKNANITDDSYKIISKKPGYLFNINYNRYFKNKIGIGIGIGASSIKNIVYQKGLFTKTNQTDKDGFLYDAWISSDMTYTSNLLNVNIPITLHLLFGKSNQCYGFIDIGIVNSLLAVQKYTEKGSVETMSRYPENQFFSTLAQNDPYYDVKYQAYDKTNSEKYKFYNLSGRCSIGLVAAMSNDWALRVEPFINIGLTDVAGKNDKGKEYVNVLGEKSAYKSTKTFAAGISIGFVRDL